MVIMRLAWNYPLPLLIKWHTTGVLNQALLGIILFLF
ncbi:Uncharacterised protein [Scardovia inopinata]|uniref:Uncharacterized protein n=1 Tax=Scardovia inopinata F0304 TaxID=641146 RepID=W1MXJ4_SCAIO|nr:hypothetical protein HMPREF9020_01494 [Scardovia inopinata F0304]SUV51948.1 Uncharacterised protein [Scardovia inopinata]